MGSKFRSYIVGGAVRDRLLGLPVQDRDWVVVGATPEDMLAQGFRPVGRDFPVFLHPHTHEEYALARTERKTAPGYKGFVFHADTTVTLEDDLVRRDLTINAIAQAEDGGLIDPYGGQQDLGARIFRHVSPAFAEDPVRILRLARFAARFPDFTLAPETLDLMRKMVAAGEVDHLVAERVWQELARGLMYERPSRMLEVLRACGALERVLPELDKLYGVPQPPQYHPEVDTGLHIQYVIDEAARRNAELPVRVAALFHDLGKGLTPTNEWPHHHGHGESGIPLIEAVCERLRIPTECRDIAVITAREHTILHDIGILRPATIAKLFERLDLARRPHRLEQMLEACACDFHGRPGFETLAYPAFEPIRHAAGAFRAVNSGAIAQATSNKTLIPERIHAARVEAIATALGR